MVSLSSIVNDIKYFTVYSTYICRFWPSQRALQIILQNYDVCIRKDFWNSWRNKILNLLRHEILLPIISGSRTLHLQNGKISARSHTIDSIVISSNITLKHRLFYVAQNMGSCQPHLRISWVLSWLFVMLVLFYSSLWYLVI